MAGQSFSKQSEYCALDVLKLIFALSVVAIHIDPMVQFIGTGGGYKLYRSFIYLAVPFFFTTSGFLMAKKVERIERLERITNTGLVWQDSELQYLKTLIKKYIKLYLIWSVIYVPLAIWHYISTGAQPLEIIKSAVIGYFWFGENYNSWALWYLLSSVYSLLFIYILRKRKLRYEIIFLIGTIIALMAVFLADYKNGVFAIPGMLGWCIRKASSLGARVLTGFFYLPLGIIIGKKWREIKKFGQLRILLCIIGLTLEIISPEYGYCYETGRALTTIGIVSIAAGIEIKEEPIYQALRGLSSALYYWHLWVWTIVCFVAYGPGNMQKGLWIYLAVITIVAAGYDLGMLIKSKH